MFSRSSSANGEFEAQQICHDAHHVFVKTTPRCVGKTTLLGVALALAPVYNVSQLKAICQKGNCLFWVAQTRGGKL